MAEQRRSRNPRDGRAVEAGVGVRLGLIDPQSPQLHEDVVLPSQWLSGPSDTGERRLLRGLLDRAFADLLLRDCKDQRDAQHWIDSNDRTWPYAFRNVMDALGLDADAVRAALRRGHVRPVRGVGRPRE